MIAKIKATALACVVMLSVGGLVPTGQASAAPVIKDFSSKGGHTQNKTGPKDRMYLVQPGDKITFTVKASDADKYVWQVNKKPVKSGSGMLTWTVPKAGGIWEIHATATGGGKSVHQEWVVSTLPAKEAPDIFEYFTDGKFDERSETDPWGRATPDWYTAADQTRPDPSRRYLQCASTGATDDEGNVNSTLYLPSRIAHGTWKFRYLLPSSRYDGQGGWTHMRFCFIGAKDPTIPPFWYTRSMDGHNYTGLGHVNRIDHDCGWSPVRKIWQEVKIIRTREGDLFTWVDDIFQFRGRELRGQKAASLNIKMAHYRPDRDPGGIICTDMVEAYHDRYLFPPKSVRYGQYIHDWVWGKLKQAEIDRWFDFSKSPTLFKVPPKPVQITLSRRTLKRWSDRAYVPVLKKGIVIDGRGVRLADIAAKVRDTKLFRYDAKTKSAICSTNLVIAEAAEMVLADGETLKFNCSADGQYEFAVMFGATLKVNNATITTTNEHYFNWRLASITHFGYHCGPLRRPIYTPYTTDLWYHGLCSVFLNGATINNCGYLFISSPMQLDITDTKFTNLREVDTAEYERLWDRKGPSITKTIKNRFKANKGFWLAMISTRTNGFNFRNVTFSGKKSPMNLTFMMNDTDYKNVNIYDIKAPAETIVVRKGLRIRGYAKPAEVESTLGLVNAKFAKIDVQTDQARAAVKYYLNVEVTDAKGKSIPDAKITVTNEADNKAYPAEGAGGEWVLADYVQDKAGKKEFTYTIEVTTPDGRKAGIKGVNPDASWYRADGLKKARTIKVVVK